MSAAPFKVKAVFDYRSEEADDLTFDNGQIITVTDASEDDWYTGDYTNAAGEHVEGIFPRNFVERYEPAIPTRPARTPRRAPPPEAPVETPPRDEPAPARPSEPLREAGIEPPHATDPPPPTQASAAPKQEPIRASEPEPTAAPAAPPAAARKGPPPVANKPSSNAFKDRIAAFNQPAAAPVAPFKPASNASSGFIKKPFVAPPPSKNSYVPPPREPAPQKAYRREEDPGLQQDEDRLPPPPPPTATVSSGEGEEDQPKPTSLKERIALLQKQQLENAQRQADPGQKKEKPKKPVKKRPEVSEEAEPVPATAEPELDRPPTNETIGRKSMDSADDDESEDAEPRKPVSEPVTMPPPPARELVSDTNDADDSGAADTEDAQETSTEEDRPRSKGTAAIGHVEPVQPKKESAQEVEEDEEEDTEEEEDPEVRRRRELRERMAKMSGGMGMMGMFGGGGSGAPPARKAKPSGEYQRQEIEDQQEAYNAPPVPIMALPGMSNQLPKRKEEPIKPDSDEEDETAQPTPQAPAKDDQLPNDYVSQPPQRSSTGRSVSSTHQGRSK